MEDSTLSNNSGEEKNRMTTITRRCVAVKLHDLKTDRENVHRLQKKYEKSSLDHLIDEIEFEIKKYEEVCNHTFASGESSIMIACNGEADYEDVPTCLVCGKWIKE